jgi:hypothetical protein
MVTTGWKRVGGNGSWVWGLGVEVVAWEMGGGGHCPYGHTRHCLELAIASSGATEGIQVRPVQLSDRQPMCTVLLTGRLGVPQVVRNLVLCHRLQHVLLIPPYVT